MSDSELNAKSESKVQWYVWAALSVVVVRLWLLPVTSSFWLDETGTFLLVQGTFSQMMEKCALWVGQPTYYIAIVWVFAQLPGQKEVILRIPSLIGLSVATVIVYRIGKRLLGNESAAAAAVIFASLSAYYASDARPYALGLMAASGAVLFLLRWMDSGDAVDGIGYACCAALTVYFHFLFSVTFLVHGVYILLRRRRGASPKLVVLAIPWALSLVLLLPLAPNLLRVISNRRSLSFLETPRLAALFMGTAPEFLYGFLITGFLVLILLCRNVRFTIPGKFSPEIWLLVSWTVAPPFLLFLVSYLTPTKIFLLRYAAVSLPGMALLLAWVIRQFEPAPARDTLVLALAVGALLEGGGRLRIQHTSENWRSGLAAVRSITQSEPIPVLVRSGFIESTDPVQFADPARTDLMLSPLVAYPISAKAIPLPYLADKNAILRLNALVDQDLSRIPKFLLVSSSGEDHYRLWLEGRLHTASYRARQIGNFGTVSVHMFERK